MEEVGRVTEIAKLTKRSVSDYRSAERQDARLRERREQESMQRQAKGAGRGRGRGRGAHGGNAAAGRPVVITQGPVCFATVFPETARMQVYGDLDEFERCRGAGGVDASLPYLVKNFNLAEISDETKKQMACFMRDFPNSIVFKGERPSYKGQSFCKHEDPNLLKTLSKYTPLGFVGQVSSQAKDVERHLNNLAFVGRGPKLQSIAMDFMGVGSVRVLTEGMLKVITMDLKEFVTTMRIPMEQTTSIDDVKDVFENTQLELQEMFSTGAKVCGGIVAAGCVLHVPTSSLVAEKALRGSFSFAVRISALVEKVAVQPYKVLLTRCSHATPRPLHSTS